MTHDTAGIDCPEPIKDLATYRRLHASFRLEVPEYFNFTGDVFDRWASERPDARAMLRHSDDGAEQSLTFAEMYRRANQVANAICELGLGRGDRVLLVLPNVVEWWELMLGLTKADIIPIPGTTQLTAKDIAYRLASAEVNAVVTDAAGAEKIDEIADRPSHLKCMIVVEPSPRPNWLSYHQLVGAAATDFEAVKTRSDDPALIYFTSGTTGMPKMVLHTHASYGIGHTLTSRFWLGLTPDDLHWNISDTGWAKAAYSSLFGPWIAGSSIFVLHRPGKFSPADVLACLERYPITTMCGPPTIYRMLVQQKLSGFQPQTLRTCAAAGEPLNAAVLETWHEATGLTIRDGYGQTESVILCANLPDLPIKPGSMGLPPPGIDLEVVDEDGNRLPTGESGQIAVRVEPARPIGLFKEYRHNPKATAKCFRGGWYLTGDCAYRDEDGYFWFVARHDDIITSSAYRIGPFEVESALMQHPAVAEVAVIGKPDPQRTEIVKAFIVLTPGFSPCDELKRELQEHTKHATAPYKYPREIEFVAELPKTPSGKVRRVELRQRG